MQKRSFGAVVHRNPGRVSISSEREALGPTDCREDCLYSIADHSVVSIELPQADILLSIAVKPFLRSNLARTHCQGDEDGPLERLLADPAIDRLLNEIDAVARDSGFSGATADAIHLALVARWLRLRTRQAIDDPGASDKKLIKWRLRRVISYIDAHIAEPITLGDLADASGLSKMYFAARFRAATGLRPHEYVLRRRIVSAKTQLESSDASIIHIAGSVGFQTQAHFTTIFKRYVGHTPARWRALHSSAGTWIRRRSKSPRPLRDANLVPAE